MGSILVNADLDTDSTSALKYTISLAGQFGADDPNLALIGFNGGSAAADFYITERDEIEKRLEAAQALVRSLVPAGMKTQWRAYLAPPVRSLIDTARLGDLMCRERSRRPTAGSGGATICSVGWSTMASRLAAISSRTRRRKRCARKHCAGLSSRSGGIWWLWA